jgi:lysophospholipase L1-like esterase
VAVALVIACGTPVPQLPPLGSDAVIVAFGDSLTKGVGTDPAQAYPAVLARLSGRTVINAGISGELSAGGVARLPAVLDEHRPDVVVLCHGGNDLLGDRNAEHLEANLREMVRIARLRGVPVVLVGVPAPGLFLSSADVYEKIADEYRLPFDGNIVPTVESDASLKSDPIHPNTEGYREMARAIYELLQAAGAL